MNSINSVLAKIISDEIFAPEIGGLYIHTFESGFEMKEPPSHDQVEVISVLHGSSYITINGQHIKIRKNECLVLFPNTTHRFFLNESNCCRLINVHFKPGDVSLFSNVPDLQETLSFFYELKTNAKSYMRFVDNSDIRDITHRIYMETKKSDGYSQAMLKLYFSELYIQLSRIISDTYNTFSKPVNRYVNNAFEYIHNNYGEKVTVNEIADYVGLSKRHLTRLFKEKLDTTILDYINILKIKKAKDLLENTKLDITNIAQQIGFTTSQYLTTCFKKHEGISPKQYRNLIHDRILNK